ncbi:MAG: fatty acid desaturase [Saprospiraceae bacterium]
MSPFSTIFYMNQQWRYLIPSLLSIVFMCLSTWTEFYYIYLVLLFANVLNWKWGEFEQKDLSDTLRFYYSSRSAALLKSINAIILIGFIFWGIYYTDTVISSLGQLIGFSITVGIFTGCFIVTLGHDLLHSSSKWHKALSGFLFTAAGIPHFASEHLCGHHREVGLKEDPTTAKINEIFYSYFFKITFSNIKSIYFTQFGLPLYFRKKIIVSNIGMIFLLICVWSLIYFFSTNPTYTLTFFIVQGFISYVLYELINYIQHYGLFRSSSNKKITLDLAWNCYYKYTNYILFLLPLHSLHHLSEKKSNITDLKAGPRMPYLYFVMIFMALIPPIWFRKMNPLVLQYNNLSHD